MTPEAILAIAARHKEGHALSCGCGKCAATAHEDRGLLLDFLARLGQVDFVYSEHPGYPCWLCGVLTAKGPCRSDCPSHALKALAESRAHPEAQRSPFEAPGGPRSTAP